MPKILKTEVTKNLKYIVDIQAEKKEYEDFKERVVDQMVKTVDIKGFRKGMAPRNLALQKIDPLKLQTTILQEAVEKFYAQAYPEVKTNIEKEGRVMIQGSAQLDPSPEHTKEDEEGNLNFRISLTILPEVDLEPIAKLELNEPAESEIENRLSFEEFFVKESDLVVKNLNKFKKSDKKANESSKLIADVKETIKGEKLEPKDSKNVDVILGQNRFPPEFEKNLIGVKAGEEKNFEAHLYLEGRGHADFIFEVKVHEVQERLYSTLEEVIANVDEAKTQLESIEKFTELLKRIYAQETNQIVETLRSRVVIKAIIEETPDFDLPQNTLDSEIERIIGVIRGQSIQQKISLAQAFAASGLPGADKKMSKDDEVLKAVEDYVKKELKLIEILRAIYYTKVDKKISEKELETLVKDIQTNPTKYNTNEVEAKNHDKALDIAFDRLLRDKAFNWVLGEVKFIIKEDKATKKVETKVEPKKAAKKEAKPAKKTTKK
jgi:trigger factor